jgi:hypothetical protein
MDRPQAKQESNSKNIPGKDPGSVETQELFSTIGRRKFLGLFLPATAAAFLAGRPEAFSAQSQAPRPKAAAQWDFKPDPALPNVLLIGDSISIGYTLDVRSLMKGKANVFRPMNANGTPANCQNTHHGLQNIHDWLGKTKWSVIHFNWGLWDLCYRSPQAKPYGHRDKIHGVQDVPIGQYGKNLEELVQILKRTKATLIWTTTTVVPPHEAGRIVGDEVKYNRVAAEVMRRNHIRTDDLYALTSKFPPSIFRTPGDVHYKSAGYERIAEQVAAAISSALQKNHAQVGAMRQFKADQIIHQLDV